MFAEHFLPDIPSPKLTDGIVTAGTPAFPELKELLKEKKRTSAINRPPE